MNSSGLKDIVIVGNDQAAWLSAAILSRALQGTAVKISVCTDQETSEAPRRQTLLPESMALIQALKIDPQTFMTQCSAVGKTADRLLDWSEPGADFFHASGDYGATQGAVEFHQALARLRRAGEPTGNLESYSLAAASARAGRFALPVADSRSIMSTFRCGCTLDTQGLLELCRELAIHSGVKVIDQNIATIDTDSPTRTITGLRLEDGSVCEAQWYIDGSQTGRLYRALDGAYESWAEQLPSNLSYEFQLPEAASQPICTLTALPSGWLKSVANHTGTTLTLYGSAESLSDQVVQEFADKIGAEPKAPQAHNPSLASQPWLGNCVALGPAAVNLPSPAHSDLDLLWLALQQLLAHMPGSPIEPTLAFEYNRLITDSYRHLRDTARLYNELTQGRKESYWRAARAAPRSDRLDYKLALFDARGKLPLLEQEILPLNWQINLMLGMGRWPAKVDPLAEKPALEDIRALCSKVQTAVNKTVSRMPKFSSDNRA